MKQKPLRALVLSLVLVFLLPVTAFAEEATVTAREVNVRTGPGMNYEVFTSLPRGYEVTVINRSNADWYAVTWEGNSGYISSRYLELSEPEDNSAVVITSYPAEMTGTVNTMYVCLRSGPGKDHAIMDILTAGKVLTITGSSGDWTAVSVDGKVGYIYSDYVSAVDPADNGVADITFESAPGTGAGSSFVLSPAASPSPSVTPIPAPTLLIVETPAPTVLIETASPAVESTPVPSAAPVAAAVRTGTIHGDGIRIRSGPGTTFIILDSFDDGQKVIITGASGDWTAVSVNGLSGYILSSFIQEDEPAPKVTKADPEDPQSITLVPDAPASEAVPEPGYITANSVRLRNGASMNAEILTELSYGTTVMITGTSGEWTAITDGPLKGYVFSEYVAKGTFRPEETIAASNASVEGKDVATFALNYVGYPYSWGGKSPATGFDCSGFVCYVYSQFGFTLSRVANDQASDGVHIDPADMQPGDVLCFYSGNGYVGHTGIYIGDGAFVHAANSATGVVTTKIEGYYATRGYEVRRIVST